MSTQETEKKEKKADPITEQSGETVKDNNDASTDAEVKKESIENTNKKETNMADKGKNEKQDLVENLETGDNKTGETTDQKKPEETGLADNVTLAPQNANQADLRLIQNGVEVSHISVPVDDDTGQYIDDQDKFKQVQNFIASNKDKKDDELKNNELLESGTQLALDFDTKVGLQAAISLGTINKYRLMLGELLNILKASFEAIKADDKNASWMKYHAASNFKFSLSSAEKYMKLAAIPNIIGWAFLGLERLEAINTVIKDTTYMKMTDPVAGFFRDSDIEIEFYQEDLDNWRDAIDIAVADNKIRMHFEAKSEDLPDGKKVEDTVDRNLVKELIEGGIECKGGTIADLFLWAKGGSDPDVILSDLIMNGGKKHSKGVGDSLMGIKTLAGLPKITSQLQSKVNVLKKNSALLARVRREHITALQEQVTALTNLVNGQPLNK